MTIVGLKENSKGLRSASGKVENNSGGGPNITVPDVIAKKFNWGAFFLSWIWGLGNRTYITLLMFVAGIVAAIPVIGTLIPIACSIWFGIKGNEWAWQNKEWESVERFHEIQKNWAIAGVVLAFLGIIISAATFGVAMMALMNSTGSY